MFRAFTKLQTKKARAPVRSWRISCCLNTRCRQFLSRRASLPTSPPTFSAFDRGSKALEAMVPLVSHHPVAPTLQLRFSCWPVPSSSSKRVLCFGISQAVILVCFVPCDAVLGSWFAIWFAKLLCPVRTSKVGVEGGARMERDILVKSLPSFNQMGTTWCLYSAGERRHREAT